MLEKKYRQYKRKFHDDFPTFQLAMTRTEDELIRIVDECMESGKDVYELGYLTTDTDCIY